MDFHSLKIPFSNYLLKIYISGGGSFEHETGCPGEKYDSGFLLRSVSDADTIAREVDVFAKYGVTEVSAVTVNNPALDTRKVLLPIQHEIQELRELILDIGKKSKVEEKESVSDLKQQISEMFVNFYTILQILP